MAGTPIGFTLDLEINILEATFDVVAAHDFGTQSCTLTTNFTTDAWNISFTLNSASAVCTGGADTQTAANALDQQTESLSRLGFNSALETFGAGAQTAVNDRLRGRKGGLSLIFTCRRVHYSRH